MNLRLNRIATPLLLLLLGGLAATTVAAAEDGPWPPYLPMQTYEVVEGETVIFALAYEDPNPDGSGSPHSFLMDEAPDPLFGQFYQVEEDGVTLGAPIHWFNTPITNSQGLVAFESEILSRVVYWP